MTSETVGIEQKLPAFSTTLRDTGSYKRAMVSSKSKVPISPHLCVQLSRSPPANAAISSLTFKPRSSLKTHSTSSVTNNGRSDEISINAFSSTPFCHAINPSSNESKTMFTRITTSRKTSANSCSTSTTTAPNAIPRCSTLRRYCSHTKAQACRTSAKKPCVEQITSAT